MADKKSNSKPSKRLFKKQRLIILNEETFEEKINFKISWLNVFVIVGVGVILTILFTSLLIAYTPLKEYIPGYSSDKIRREATTLLYKTDSLEGVIEKNNRYFESIQHALMGDTLAGKDEEDTLVVEDQVSAEEVSFETSKADSILRKEVEQKDKYSVLNPATDQSNFKLFPPVKGSITAEYDSKKSHFGIDLSLTENTPIKAVADGTVIFAEWSAETGYVVILEHDYGLLSVYKHNSSLTKEQGEHVKAGEVIAMSGNTGEYSSGPHLHFELWKDGYSINPNEFLEFE